MRVCLEGCDGAQAPSLDAHGVSHPGGSTMADYPYWLRLLATWPEGDPGGRLTGPGRTRAMLGVSRPMRWNWGTPSEFRIVTVFDSRLYSRVSES